MTTGSQPARPTWVITISDPESGGRLTEIGLGEDGLWRPVVADRLL
ncbi:hypothetical protein [Klenkia brasiliensis]|uniref:Uncharacterized protein n=1 Tax=Klenkia brasiliensis TaxID=333142 RepID=A0A1G7TC36_9ACTN|nr:hypothetical protein [Klenkia brasiliensis]SDG32160.1 hypothetical protein SAMN05660324_2379 [Klenkia brasiliensis]